MAEELDYYAILDVPTDADAATIRFAFRRLARRYHPDIAGTGSLERMQQINVAYQTLSDPAQRRIYDVRRGTPSRPHPPASPASAPTPPPSAPPTPQTPHPHPARPPAPHTGALSHTAGPLQRRSLLDSRDEAPVAALAFALGGMRAGVGLLDGRVVLWDLPASRAVGTLTFGSASVAGVLQDLRLSPGGTLAMAWGFQLGTRVWSSVDGRTLWNSGINAPSGTMDAVLADTPAHLRMALPDAPISLADDDPFRWAHEGRTGTAILTRPLAGPVDPAWAIPSVISEAGSGGLFGEPPDETRRVQLRLLSADARFLFTCSSGRAPKLPRARFLHLWQIDHRSMLGGAQPRRVARIAESLDNIDFPLAATPDLAWIASSYQGYQMRVLALHSGDRRVIRTDLVPEDARAALSPDGRYLALAANNRLDLWQTRDGAHLQEWHFATEITALEFAPGASPALLGIGLRNGLVEMWA
jgi:DnaJ domain